MKIVFTFFTEFSKALLSNILGKGDTRK